MAWLVNCSVDCAAGMFKKENEERKRAQKEREDEGIY
jgi:hypothetical protein